MISDKKLKAQEVKKIDNNLLEIFSETKDILRDEKHWNKKDIIRIKKQLDTKPYCFDFGSGNILVIRFDVEAIDGNFKLYVPAIKSFLFLIKEGKYFEIKSKRVFHWEIKEEGENEWILYINRIKNLYPIVLNIKQRMVWKLKKKTDKIFFNDFDDFEEKLLPMPNSLKFTKKYMESVKDIDRETLLSKPIKIIRLEFKRQLEITKYDNSIIKNLEYSTLTHNNKIFNIYVPYFLKDIISSLEDKLQSSNLLVSQLKLIYLENNIGFLWDCTLSGFEFENKTYQEKLMTLQNGSEFFFGEDSNNFIQFLLHTKNKYKNLNRYIWKHPKKNKNILIENEEEEFYSKNCFLKKNF